MIKPYSKSCSGYQDQGNYIDWVQDYSFLLRGGRVFLGFCGWSRATIGCCFSSMFFASLSLWAKNSRKMEAKKDTSFFYAYGAYTDRRGGRAAQEIAQPKKADALNSWDHLPFSGLFSFPSSCAWKHPGCRSRQEWKQVLSQRRPWNCLHRFAVAGLELAQTPWCWSSWPVQRSWRP